MATFYQMNTPRGHLAPQLGGGLPGDRLGRGGGGLAVGDRRRLLTARPPR